MNNNIKNIIIALLLILICFLALKPNQKETIRDRIKYDTIKLKSTEIINSKPIIIKRIDTVRIDTGRIDTVKIIDSFFSKNIYSDTIKSGKNKIIINDTLQRNQIIGRSVNIDIENIMLKPVKPKLTNEVWINPTYGNNIGCNVMIIRGRFGISSGYNNGLNVGILIRVK